MSLLARKGKSEAEISRSDLGTDNWVDATLSARDPLMVSLRLRISGILDEYPTQVSWRGEARPADQRAFAVQLAINVPAG